MKQRRRGGGRWGIVLAAAVAATSISVGLPVAYGAEGSSVTAVTGGAVGYSANVSHFGGPSTARGPAGTTGCDASSSDACSPSVTLPSSGGLLPASDTDGATSKYGPAILFQSTSMEVSTQGTTGDAGTVTSSARAAVVGPGPFSAGVASSTCTASSSGTSGSAAIERGRLVTKTDAASGEPVATEAIQATPAANTTYTGTLDHVGDRFKAVVNEQISNPDGSITVNALHLYLLGPTAVGELIVGQSVCGVTSTARAKAPSSGGSGASSPEVASAPEAVASGARLGGAAPAVATAVAPAGVPAAVPTGGSGAFGYYAEVSLFGGPAAPKGPTPNVTLPAAGSGTPITQTSATGDVRYGPGILFTSGPITASTQGTAASATSKVDIQNLNTSGVEVLSGRGMSSTCTGGTGSTTITDGVLRTSEGNPDVDGDDTTVPVPANPPPNTRITGKIESVQDSFEAVFNEQTVSGGGITVTAYHLKLLGPTAVGDVFIGQSRCSATAATTTTVAGATSPTSRGNTAAANNNRARGANPGMATTGFGGLGLLLLATALLVLGTASTVGGARLRGSAREQHPADAGP